MPPSIRPLLSLAALVVIGVLDSMWGPRVAFAPFYLVTIALTAWYAGQGIGLATAIVAGSATPVLELVRGAGTGATVWNAVVWTAVFVATARFVGWARGRHDEVATLDARVGELVQIEHAVARTDPLTSLCNRRAFIDALQQAEARSRRGGGPLAVVRLDIDGFRRLNEVHSRSAGDQLLRAVATSLSLTTRMGDVAARLEDDEFSILLYGCGAEDALRVGRRVVAEIQELGRAYPDAAVTASVGIACFVAPGPDPDGMMRLAGAAMERAREEGGNGVVLERNGIVERG